MAIMRVVAVHSLRVGNDGSGFSHGPTREVNDRTGLGADQSDLADVKSKPSAAPTPKNKPRSGYVALQSHSGRVEFRKVQIREP